MQKRIIILIIILSLIIIAVGILFFLARFVWLPLDKNGMIE